MKYFLSYHLLYICVYDHIHCLFVRLALRNTQSVPPKELKNVLINKHTLMKSMSGVNDVKPSDYKSPKNLSIEFLKASPHLNAYFTHKHNKFYTDDIFMTFKQKVRDTFTPKPPTSVGGGRRYTRGYQVSKHTYDTTNVFIAFLI